MRLACDANLFIAIVVGEDDAGQARRLLNADHDFFASMYTVMEVRHVLARQYNLARERIEAVEETVRKHADPVSHGSLLIQRADEIQQDTYVTTMDALMLATADHINGTLVSFDGELLEHGAVSPGELL